MSRSTAATALFIACISFVAAGQAHAHHGEQADTIGLVGLGALSAASTSLAVALTVRTVQRRRSLWLIVGGFTAGVFGSVSGVFGLLGEGAHDALGAICLATSLSALALAAWNIAFDDPPALVPAVAPAPGGGAAISLALRF